MDDLTHNELHDFKAHTEEIGAELCALFEQALATLERLQLWQEHGDRLLAVLEDDE